MRKHFWALDSNAIIVELSLGILLTDNSIFVFSLPIMSENAGGNRDG